MSKKAQDPPVKKNAFVHKLFTMLSDPKLTHLIWWSGAPEHNTFALFPGKEFAEALTGYFKHGNVASFVRQLHMYGFHKVSEPSSANAIDKEAAPVWEFKHSSGKFRKGDESSLIYIKRRSSSNSSRNSYNGENNHHQHMHHPSQDYALTPSPTTYDMHAPNAQYFPPPPQYLQYYGPTGNPIPLPHPHSHMQPVPMPPHTLPLPKHDSTLVQVPYSYPYPPQPVYAAYPQSYPPQTSYLQHAPPPHLAPQQQQLPPPPVVVRPSSPQDAALSPSTKRNHSDPVHSSTAPTPSIKVQHYSPNLQFRKIWETTSSNSARPRNPSLLYDPLAPAPAPVPVPTDPQVYRPHYQPTPTSRNNSNTTSTSSFSRDSIDSRSSIKLPPPSSIHRSSSGTMVYAKPKSPEPTNDESPIPTTHPRSIPANFEASPLSTSAHPPLPAATAPPAPSAPTMSTTSSLPSSPSTIDAKRPSFPPNTSIKDRLRPSLIELYYPPPPHKPADLSADSSHILSHKNSIIRNQNDSIGSQSSHNSIFSNQSSVSSISTTTFQRASSFGSISHHGLESNGKSSVSVSPHDQVAAKTYDVLPPTAQQQTDIKLPSFRSLTPPLSSNGSKMVQRNSASHRSLTSSPLSKTNTDPSKKVSVESLLDDGQSNGVTIRSDLIKIEENEHDSDLKRRRLS
ncbi:HSF-type DNA-binding-domain-containing protein [Scheffersomyces amazonensis]|uniref:HSF-type DNA-binding-domain-containing protein n=1 Tax=Scheffersomyces amazonensis TaxID=1078765 RepID=UPI00315DB69E